MPYQSTTNGRRWPTRRMAQWAAAATPGPIVSIATLDAWLAANVTTIAQAQAVFRELIRAMAEMADGGENGS